MDNLTREQRQRNMRNIRSKGTIPEQILFKELKKLKIKFSQHLKSLPGKPDFVLRKYKIVIFVDSDFWHGHYKRFIMPKSNTRYWENKIMYNKRRDRKVNRILRNVGWNVIRFWEFDIKNDITKCKNRLLKLLET